MNGPKRHESLSALAVAFAFADAKDGKGNESGLRAIRSVCQPTVRSAHAERIPTHDSGTMLATRVSISTVPATAAANGTPTMPAPRSGIPTVPAPAVRLEVPTLPAPANVKDAK